MANGKLGYRSVMVLEAAFRFRVKPLETEFLFADGSVKIYSNWDIKGVRKRHYMDEYVSVPVEEYLRSVSAAGEIVEYGIGASDIKKFVEGKREYFEDLLLDAAGNISLNENDVE
jgi:hypothetical protein